MSDRIIDCPTKVIVIAGDCGRAGAHIAHTIANRITRGAALGNVQSGFNMV